MLPYRSICVRHTYHNFGFYAPTFIPTNRKLSSSFSSKRAIQTANLLNRLYWNIIRTHSNIILDEVNAIMYSLNELNNGYLTTIQLVIILGNLFYRKTFTDPLNSQLTNALLIYINVHLSIIYA